MITKAVKLDETVIVHHGVMLAGQLQEESSCVEVWLIECFTQNIILISFSLYQVVFCIGKWQYGDICLTPQEVEFVQVFGLLLCSLNFIEILLSSVPFKLE
jgi:hypothetical protein